MADTSDLIPDLTFPRRVHVIGAGGSGMSAIATVLLEMGHRVSGSDAADSNALRRLEGRGAEVHAGHDAAWLGDADVIVRSTAIPTDNVEVLEAESRGLRVWRRADVLSAICAKRRTLAVSGTHGKTTTTSMLGLLLGHAGRHPSMIIGGEVAGLASGAVWDPEGELLVVEADESDGTFLRLGAEGVVVTSVEPDHLDFYGTEAAMRAAYERFVAESTGPVVLCADDAGALALAGALAGPGAARVVTYGVSKAADVRVVDVAPGRFGSEFSLVAGGAAVGPIHLPVPGIYNVRNAAAAMSMATAVGVDWETAAAAVALFGGVGRRFEMRGERDGVVFVDDYGHLPTEVASVVTAARAGEWSRLVVVFQPHRYSRTESLWRDFAGAFDGFDVLVVTGIYPAGEPARPGVTGELVYRAVRQRHPGADVRYAETLDDTVSVLGSILRPGDLCLTLGAGDLTTVPSRMLSGPPWR